MDEDYNAAARILTVYELALPFGRPATFVERLEAMRYAVGALELKETVCDANFREIARIAARVTP